MFEEIPINEKEKTKEELLEEFVSSLERHGVKDVEVRIEGNILIIEQEYGKGIRGWGKSDSSIWVCPDQNKLESFSENDGFNANTNIDFRKEYLGLTFGKNEDGKKTVEFDADHPITTFANLLGKNDQVCLPGQFNEWKKPKQLKFDEDTGTIGGVIEREKGWNEEEAQCKVSIYIDYDKSDIEIFEEDGIKKQRMKISLEEENMEE
ncbi:hypothetical protein KAS31_04880 [Candidatus Parcubacteria bacterium]|nr:hypothetical protein [Candidatus Parcubacteria bacterium]